MNGATTDRRVRQVVQGVRFSLLLCGLFYAGFANERLKGNIADVHRGVLLIGFIIGVYAASSYFGAQAAERLTQKKIARRR